MRVQARANSNQSIDNRQLFELAKKLRTHVRGAKKRNSKYKMAIRSVPGLDFSTEKNKNLTTIFATVMGCKVGINWLIVTRDLSRTELRFGCLANRVPSCLYEAT